MAAGAGVMNRLDEDQLAVVGQQSVDAGQGLHQVGEPDELGHRHDPVVAPFDRPRRARRSSTAARAAGWLRSSTSVSETGEQVDATLDQRSAAPRAGRTAGVRQERRARRAVPPAAG